MEKRLRARENTAEYSAEREMRKRVVLGLFSFDLQRLSIIQPPGAVNSEMPFAEWKDKRTFIDRTKSVVTL